MSVSIRDLLALTAAGALGLTAPAGAAGRPAGGQAAESSPAPAASLPTDPAARRARVLHWIEVGRLQGWLSRPESRSYYREVSRLKQREAEMRDAAGGVLREADRADLARGYDELARNLRWDHEHNRQGRLYRPH